MPAVEKCIFIRRTKYFWTYNGIPHTNDMVWGYGTDRLKNGANFILKTDKTSATIWNFLALGYQNIGEIDKATNLYDSLLKGNASNFLLNTNAGNVYFSIGRINDSIKCLKAALSAQPEHIATLYSLGLALYETGDSTEAKSLFTKVVKNDPNHSAARFRLGRLLQFEKKFVGAAEQFSKTDYSMSKTHQLECYYLLGEQSLFSKKYTEFVINNSPNPLMATIGCHASIRFDLNEENSFCNKTLSCF